MYRIQRQVHILWMGSNLNQIKMEYKNIQSESYFTITLKKEDWRTILRGLKAESEVMFLGSTAKQYEDYHNEIAQIQRTIKEKISK